MTSLDSLFELRARGSSVGRELRGAVATFLTMAYILFVNPLIVQGSVGMPDDVAQSLVACTALAAGICCILMGLVANFPIALASGMGLNAVVAYTVSKATGSWQAAMGLIVLDGLVTLVLVLGGLREAIMDAIPRDLRLAIGAGIGLFIAFIGLSNAHILIATGRQTDPVQPGSWSDPQAAFAILGLIVTSVLVARRVKGALIIGIVGTTLLALALGSVKSRLAITRWPHEFVAPSFKAAFHADVLGAMKLSLMPLLFSIIMVDFFDTLGTASAIAEEARLVNRNGQIPGIRRILMIDSLSAAIGGMLGASSVTSYIESAAGVAEGARTGLHSVFVGLFFLASIFLAPIAGVVPPAATAPALILVGFLMLSQLSRIDWEKLDSAIPAFLVLLTIPLTYSIAHGIGYGFITFVAIKLLTGRWRDAHLLMYLTAAAFAAYFLLGARV